jgi:hypothetical protein
VESNSGISLNSLLLNQPFNFLSETPTTPTGGRSGKEKDKKTHEEKGKKDKKEGQKGRGKYNLYFVSTVPQNSLRVNKKTV